MQDENIDSMLEAIQFILMNEKETIYSIDNYYDNSIENRETVKNILLKLGIFSTA
jgi:hypothetical protein